jgi:hypothetical protein
MNGKPTYFIEKILKSLVGNNLIDLECWTQLMFQIPDVRSLLFSETIPFKLPLYKPKHHTIREDKNDRWQVGTKIDFFINCRQKDMFRFTPVLPVVSIQKVEIRWYNSFGRKSVRVFIDEKSHSCTIFDENTLFTGEIVTLANNDGFDNVEDFFAYFNEDFKGKIIHWTDLRY